MAAVKATVFYVGGPIAVCRLELEEGVAVAEASVDADGTVRILPQTVRMARVRYGVEVVMPDEANAQDEVDRLALQIRRFRLRLKKFDRSTLEGTAHGRVLAQARGAMRDLTEFVP